MLSNWQKSSNWQRKYADSLSRLKSLQPVLDPKDNTGKKNRRINKIHLCALDKVFKKIKHESIEYLLDYGCGIGRLYDFLSSRCNHYIGVDISPKMLEKAKGETYLIKGPKLPFKNSYFDLIFVFWVLQHVTDNDMLDNILGEFNRVLRPNGTAIICERSSLKSSFEPGKEKEYINRRSPNTYIRMFSKHGMKCLHTSPLFYSKKTYIKYLFKNRNSKLLKNRENIYVFKKT